MTNFWRWLATATVYCLLATQAVAGPETTIDGARDGVRQAEARAAAGAVAEA